MTPEEFEKWIIKEIEDAQKMSSDKRFGAHIRSYANGRISGLRDVMTKYASILNYVPPTNNT